MPLLVREQRGNHAILYVYVSGIGLRKASDSGTPPTEAGSLLLAVTHKNEEGRPNRSVTESIAAIEAAGGKLRSNIADIPGVGKVIEFADTEGNIACVMQYEPGHPCAVR